MAKSFMESVVEEAAIDWLKSLGYSYMPGPDIACDGPHPERGSYSDVVLVERLRSALCRLKTPAATDAWQVVARLGRGSAAGC